MTFLVARMQSGQGDGTRLSNRSWCHIERCGPNGDLMIACDPARPVSPACVRSESGHLIVGRIRLDAKADLRRALGPDAGAAASDLGVEDARLALRAYEKWGDSFAARLDGDFSFALWDVAQSILLCGRDRLGVRPLFWTQTTQALFVSDDLEALPRPTERTWSLDPVWIAGYLTDAIDVPAHATVYADVVRVPPATVVAFSDRGQSERRYWQLTLDEPFWPKDPREVPRRFRDHVTAAVADRIPGATGPVGIAMSGGLDSTTLAAITAECIPDRSRVFAQSRVYRSLIPDDEERFCRLTADKLAIPLNLIDQAAVSYDPVWWQRDATPPEPSDSIVSASFEAEIAAEMAQKSAVWFYGEGPDNALTFEWRPYLRWLWRGRRWSRLSRALTDLVVTTPRREWKLGFQRLARGGKPWIDASPPVDLDWLSTPFATSADLSARAASMHEARRSAHAWRPKAMNSFASSIWPSLLEEMDPVLHRQPIEWRHPYLDRRVIEFLIAVPPLPWSRGKQIIRASMAGRLPDEVLKRPKTPVAHDILALFLLRHPLPPLTPASPVAHYIDPDRLAAYAETTGDTYPLLKAHILNHWMQNRGYH